MFIRYTHCIYVVAQDTDNDSTFYQYLLDIVKKRGKKKGK